MLIVRNWEELGEPDWASQVVLVVKKLPASAGNVRDARSPGWEDPLEEGMAIHSSILARRIPWTEESSKIESMGSQRVSHTTEAT